MTGLTAIDHYHMAGTCALLLLSILLVFWVRPR